ncbi:MAG: cytochrome c biogenesis protein ResB [Clostridia bacterium]|nr:cytochrome c biogenesis protein ResB [Clostridia bacterium]
MKLLKKIARFLGSMRFALILLLLVVAACTAGSLIPQGETEAALLARYPGAFGKVVTTLGLGNVFFTPWFLVLTGLLCLNLLLCNLVRFPKLRKKMRRYGVPDKTIAVPEDAPATREPERVFAQMGFRKVETTMLGGRRVMFAAKHRCGVWGAWLTHLGMLIVILGFGLGQLLQQEYTVYGVPGQTKQIGDTGYALTIDAFEVALREDDTVEQYTAQLTVTDTATGETQAGTVCVNEPMQRFGLKFYQNSTGWAATAEATRGDKLLKRETLCAGEYMTLEDPAGLSVLLRAFYPDYAEDATGKPMTASGKATNPAYVYMLYYGEHLLGMNLLQGGDAITVDDITIRFTDPKPYTLIQIKRDAFVPLTAAGAAVLIIGLLFAFYLYPAELRCTETEEGVWRFAGRSAKADAVFQERLTEAVPRDPGKEG